MRDTWYGGKSALKRVEIVKQFKIQTYRDLLKNTGKITKENLFMFLGRVQDKFGYVPREVVCDLAARTGISEARIYGALTSYGDFEIAWEVKGQNAGE